MKSKIRAVTFDAGGTLLYPYPSVGHIYCSVAKNYGTDIDAGVLQSSFHKELNRAEGLPLAEVDEVSYKHWWKRVVKSTLTGLSITVVEFDLFFEELWREFANPENWQLYPDAHDTLVKLSDLGIRLAILSNWDNRLRMLLTGLGVDVHFEEIIISSEVGCEKPGTGIFELTEQRLGLSSHEILHVGDSIYHDHFGATNAGWDCVVINRSDRGPDPQYNEIQSLTEIIEFLKR